VSVGGLLPELDAALDEGLLNHIIVIDNGSSDGTPQLLGSWAGGRDDITLELRDDNVGFPRAVNAGLRRAQTTYVALLNPDVSKIRASLRTCLDQLRNDLAVGLCGPRLVMPDGRLQVESARRLPGAWSLALQVMGISRFHNGYRRWRIAAATKPRDVRALSGAFIVARSQQLRGLGGLDERLFMYLEDVSLCRVVRESGLRLVCVPEVAAHECGASRQTLTGTQHRVLDCLIGEVPWLLSRDAGRAWSCRIISLLTFILGLEYVIFPGRSSRTGVDLLRWSVSTKPLYVGWTPSFAVSERTA
jgi:GT2 family glycosyltransferase